MSDVMDDFPHLNSLSVPEIHQRYQTLKASPDASGKLSDDTLRELLALARILRKRSSAPSAKAKSTKALPPSLDAL